MKKNLAAFFSLLFMFLVPIGLIIFLSVYYRNGLFWLLLLIFEGVAIGFSIAVGLSKRRLEVKTRWVLFLILVPVIGLFSYIFFGRGYPERVKEKYSYQDIKLLDESQRKEVQKNALTLLEENNPEYVRSFSIGLKQQGDQPFMNTKAHLFDNAALGWIQIFKDIEKAQDYILINFYIIEEGDLWNNLEKLLVKKAKQGVKIYIIFDFIGSYGTFTYKTQKRLADEGIKTLPYMKMTLPFLNWKSDYRDHRKDVSIDGKIGYFGGANLGDDYINMTAEQGFWHDETVRIVGDAVLGIEKIFLSDYEFITKKDLLKEEPMIGKQFGKSEVVDSKDIVQINASGPNHKYPGNLDILLNIISNAKKRVWLSTPYFIPPVELLNTIASAARSGIDVRLVLPGRTDKAFILDVSKKHTDDLFDAGVKIYSMNNTFNHTKAYLVDDDLSFVGSTNLDYRALFSDQQTMGLIYSKDFNKQLENRFENDFRLSKLYKSKPSKEHNWLNRVAIWIVNIVAPLL